MAANWTDGNIKTFQRHWLRNCKRNFMSRPIPIKGYRLDKSGKVVKTTKHLDVSTRLKQAGSKKIRVRRKSA